jgi:hypothetical protein
MTTSTRERRDIGYPRKTTGDPEAGPGTDPRTGRETVVCFREEHTPGALAGFKDAFLLLLGPQADQK